MEVFEWAMFLGASEDLPVLGLLVRAVFSINYIPDRPTAKPTFVPLPN